MSKDRSHGSGALDPYTKDVLERGLSRRSFLRRAAVGAAGAGVLGATGLSAGPASAADKGLAYAKSSDGGATLSFMPKPKPIAEKDIATTQTFDVVVVGAGAAGVPAALSAAEHGASVAVIQKAPFAISQGNSGTGIDLAKSDKAGVEALVAKLLADNAHRPNPKLIRQWAYNSGEAVSWVIDRAKRGGAQVIDQGNLQQRAILKVNGYTLNYVTSFFGPKPYTTGDGMRALATVAEKAGVRFFYGTPAAQLVQDRTGEVKGVIAKGKDHRYHRFLARKGVILATGDYQNNEAMSNYFLPDLKHLGRKQLDKTGDGFVMAYWAGGVIEPIGHTKMLHDFDAGPASMCDMPFLAVDREGKRFVNETVEMSLINNYLRDEKNAGHYSQIFDSNYMTQAASWPGKLVPPEGLKNYMPDDPGPKKGVFESLVNTHVADTLEALARKIEVDPSTLVATVKRYNELCRQGQDADFGKPADRLAPVEKPPFYGIHRKVRVSAICSGLLVDEQHQALDADGRKIPGLFLVGNLGAGFYGGTDYPLTVFGLSLGRCYTFGYLTGRHVAKL
ncbi:FAD-dependent oxidoreductase [Anaeromyxobacter dehalogenans]|nr:FAD-dependent oxidoreductase [Anaeromyxobacter dehalogenans]